MKKKSGQNDAFNPFKSAPKAERANITARAKNAAPMVSKPGRYSYIPTSYIYAKSILEYNKFSQKTTLHKISTSIRGKHPWVYRT